MSPSTGQVYRGQLEIDLARERGEDVVEVSEQVADAVEIGMLALKAADRRRRGFAVDRKRPAKRGKRRR